MSRPAISKFIKQIDKVPVKPVFRGKVENVRGLLIEGSGNDGRIGDLFRLETQDESSLLAEVVGIRGGSCSSCPSVM